MLPLGPCSTAWLLLPLTAVLLPRPARPQETIEKTDAAGKLLPEMVRWLQAAGARGRRRLLVCS